MVLDQVKEVPDKKSQKADHNGKDMKQTPEQKTSDKKLKRPNKELNKKEKVPVGSRKTAKIKTEWQVRITDGSNESSSSSDNIPEHEDGVTKTKEPDKQENKECCQKKNDKRGSNKKQRWMPKPTSDVSVSEPSSAEGSDSEERKEYIYTQVCKRINQLTIELDKLRQALPVL